MTAEAAAETGLAVGTPVTTGTIDAGAEALSVGVLDDGDMLLMYGSTIFIIEITPVRVPDARLWYAPWFFPASMRPCQGSRPPARSATGSANSSRESWTRRLQ